VLHAQVSEEAGLLAQLSNDLFVHALDFVKHFFVLADVREVSLQQADLVVRLGRLEFLADALFVFLVHE